MKPSGIGGQAVIEGVMMKNKEQYAIAVRTPDKKIVVEKNSYISASEKIKILKLPILRGILAFIESMIIGMKTLTFSASFYEEEEEKKPGKMEAAFSKVFKDKAENVVMGITLTISILLAVGIFILLPAFISSLLTSKVDSQVLLSIIEGIIRITIFISYITLISQMKDIKRVFMYHGAEHKTINCLEQGFELTVENVKWQSKQHKRCGTSFMFLVMLISIIFFIFIRVDYILMRYVIRLLLVPVIAGVSYEFIRFAGRNDSKLVNILSKPGLWLQGLTTKEPDDDMIEVAIQSVEAVFDWRDFLGMKEDESLKDQENAVKKVSASRKERSSLKQNQKKEKDKAASEIAATVEDNASKASDNITDSIFGEEDDEILLALDRYLTVQENNKGD